MPVQTPPHSALASWTAGRVTRRVRRFTVVVALATYPLLALAFFGLRDANLGPIVWAAAVLGLLIVLAGAAASLYTFQNALAQQTDAALDERQVAVRDRAYLIAYRIFALIVLVTLLVLGIGSDVLRITLPLDFDSLQPYFWGAIYYSIILPSAVVAWMLPDYRD